MRLFEAKREAGKQAFGSKNWSEAVDCYTEALEVDPENDQMQILFRNNRAMALNAVRPIPSLLQFPLTGRCNQLKRYEEVVADCDFVLSVQSTHWKA